MRKCVVPNAPRLESFQVPIITALTIYFSAVGWVGADKLVWFLKQRQISRILQGQAACKLLQRSFCLRQKTQTQLRLFTFMTVYEVWLRATHTSASEVRIHVLGTEREVELTEISHYAFVSERFPVNTALVSITVTKARNGPYLTLQTKTAQGHGRLHLTVK